MIHHVSRLDILNPVVVTEKYDHSHKKASGPAPGAGKKAYIHD
jgi:hypothetical protein